MKGTVEPPSSSSTAALTCRSRTPSSSAILPSMDPTRGVVTIPYRLLTEVAPQLWQAEPTGGDQGATRAGRDGRDQARCPRAEPEALPKSRARARKGSVTTV